MYVLNLIVWFLPLSIPGTVLYQERSQFALFVEWKLWNLPCGMIRLQFAWSGLLFSCFFVVYQKKELVNWWKLGWPTKIRSKNLNEYCKLDDYRGLLGLLVVRIFKALCVSVTVSTKKGTISTLRKCNMIMWRLWLYSVTKLMAMTSNYNCRFGSDRPGRWCLLTGSLLETASISLRWELWNWKNQVKKIKAVSHAYRIHMHHQQAKKPSTLAAFQLFTYQVPSRGTGCVCSRTGWIERTVILKRACNMQQVWE